MAIKAFARVAAELPDARLDMIGSGPMLARCRDLVGSFDLQDRITLHAARDANFVADLLARASLFIQHSVTAPDGDTEGFGISLVEAMASAVPLVVTRHNGFVEVVEDGRTGLLVEEHDVVGMAAAMLALLKDPVRAAAMGQAGRERVISHFTRERSRDGLRAILRLDGEC